MPSTYRVDLRKTGHLTADETDMLDLERSWWKYPGAKETAIRDRFGCSPTRYYQRLNALIDRPEALAHDPLLVRRLLRLRNDRRDERASRRRHPSAQSGR